MGACSARLACAGPAGIAHVLDGGASASSPACGTSACSAASMNSVMFHLRGCCACPSGGDGHSAVTQGGSSVRMCTAFSHSRAPGPRPYVQGVHSMSSDRPLASMNVGPSDMGSQCSILHACSAAILRHPLGEICISISWPLGAITMNAHEQEAGPIRSDPPSQP